LKREYRFFVYTIASKSRVLYTGVTSKLRRRVSQHKGGLLEGFTRRYKCNRLVHVECFDDIRTAINREKQIKGWSRAKKVALVEATNPLWNDLAKDWFDAEAEQQIPRCARNDTVVDSFVTGGSTDEQQIPDCARIDTGVDFSVTNGSADQQRIPRCARNDTAGSETRYKEILERTNRCPSVLTLRRFSSLAPVRS
jgi:putative endonuclease